jgi:hypothetical protein
MKALALALVVVAACHASTDGPDRKEASNMPQAFSCDRAPSILGYPRASTEMCKELLPDYFWIALKGGGVPGGMLQKQIVVENGAVAETGAAAAKRWLTRAKILAHQDARPFDVATALQVLGAVPPGFDPQTVDAKLPQLGLAGGLVFDPFTLTLVTDMYDPQGNLASDTGGMRAPRPARAILRGTADYQFTWTVEQMENGKDWVQVSQSPLP